MPVTADWWRCYRATSLPTSAYCSKLSEKRFWRFHLQFKMSINYSKGRPTPLKIQKSVLYTNEKNCVTSWVSPTRIQHSSCKFYVFKKLIHRQFIKLFNCKEEKWRSPLRTSIIWSYCASSSIACEILHCENLSTCATMHCLCSI